MRRFRFLFDPACLLACFLYGFHRWLISSAGSTGFFQNHGNDLLLIPAALPPVLWLQRRMGLRNTDVPPTAAEIFGHWIVWAVVCEVIGPLLFSWNIGDSKDVLVYGAGALIAYLWWNRQQIFCPDGPARFDTVASYYDVMENVLAGNKLERCRNATWNKFPQVTNALLVGEGHGRFLSTLIQRNPLARVTCVDASAKMLAVSRKRLLRQSLPLDRVNFIQADLPGWHPPAAQYDLIATHFFLDCFNQEQLRSVISQIQMGARPGTYWIVSDFQIPARGVKRLRAQIIHGLMYGFFRLATRIPTLAVVAPQSFLMERGYQCIHHEEFEWGLLYSELWQS